MIKLPFSRKPEGKATDRSTVAFLEYCHDELERRRDTGEELDEKGFQAAVDLAVNRLRALEDRGKS